MGKCEICGKTLKKEGRKICYGCACSQKFAKNGGNTCQTRLNTAINHLQKSKPGLLTKIFGL